MIYPIIKEPAKILRQKAQPLLASEMDTPKLHKLAKDMIHTMYETKGVGLAAPQIGLSQRIIAIGAPDLEPIVLVNPEIVKRSLTSMSSEEGCLSVPGVWGFVRRSKTITVKGFTTDGKPWKKNVRDFEGTIYQHEIDHLNGILFIDKAKNMTKLGVNPL